MKNEGIDVEKEVVDIIYANVLETHRSTNVREIKNRTVDLIARVRAATEAEVTKREREKVTQLVEVARYAYNRILATLTWTGIYPKAWEGEWDKRTKLQEKWNRNHKAILRRTSKAKERFEQALSAYESNDAGEIEE